MSVTYTSHRAEIDRDIDRGLLAGLSAAGAFVEGEAAQIITDNRNIDTGRLRGSITYSIDNQTSATKSPASATDAVSKESRKDTVVIGTNVQYAEFIEYAIRGKGKPFLRPAVDNNRRLIERIITAELNKGLR